MMPAILVTTILGTDSFPGSFEIELSARHAHRSCRSYSTKIHELVTWEPPQFAPAMALSTVFLGALTADGRVSAPLYRDRVYTTMTGRGFSTRRTQLGRWRYPAFSLVLSFALVITVLPTTLLVTGTFMKLFGFFNIVEPWTLDNWRATLNDPCCIRSLWNTLAIGLGSGFIGSLFYSLIAYVVVKTRYRGRWPVGFSVVAAVVDPRHSLRSGVIVDFLADKNIFTDLWHDLYLDGRHGDQEHAVRRADDQKRVNPARQRSRRSFQGLRRHLAANFPADYFSR